jgi:hypothetical protein
LNAMKISFLSYQAEHENVKFVVNRNNNYMCVKTENLKLLDIYYAWIAFTDKTDWSVVVGNVGAN